MVLWAEEPEGAKTRGLTRTEDSGCWGEVVRSRSPGAGRKLGAALQQREVAPWLWGGAGLRSVWVLGNPVLLKGEWVSRTPQL